MTECRLHQTARRKKNRTCLHSMPKMPLEVSQRSEGMPCLLLCNRVMGEASYHVLWRQDRLSPTASTPVFDISFKVMKTAVKWTAATHDEVKQIISSATNMMCQLDRALTWLTWLSSPLTALLFYSHWNLQYYVHSSSSTAQKRVDMTTMIQRISGQCEIYQASVKSVISPNYWRGSHGNWKRL